MEVGIDASTYVELERIGLKQSLIPSLPMTTIKITLLDKG